MLDQAYFKAEKKIQKALQTGVKTLDLIGMKLTELPEWLGELTQLEALHLSSNQLTVLPESIGQLTQLQTLYLGDNQLTVLPDSLGQLTQLRDLRLFRNQLTSLPDSLGQLTQLQTLNLSGNKLTALPDSLGQLTQLQTLHLGGNPLKALPDSLGQLTQLQELNISSNQLTVLPDSLGQLTQLQTLHLSDNELMVLPEWLKRLTQLRDLNIPGNHLTALPEWLGQFKQLHSLGLGYFNYSGNPISRLPSSIGEINTLWAINAINCKLVDLPTSIGRQTSLTVLNLEKNPLNPELAAAYKQGLDAVKAYLRAKAEDQIVLNEAKLILIGEGEVGKTSLLGVLRGDEWVENRPTTHGVEVDIKSLILTDPTSQTEITFNAWDFGGQDIYKHTHQLFFTAPAIYLAVWDPRGGAEKCRVEDWIKLVKHRAYDENRHDDRPRIIIVATRGGPIDRLAHIDEETIRDQFGDMIVGFHHVDSRPDDATGKCKGIEELKEAIASTAVSIQQVGRTVPKSWKDMLEALRKRSEKDPYITFNQFRALCRCHKVSNELADTYAVILNELGHLIHYSSDAVLQDTVILKPEYLSKAISCVLEDEPTKGRNGLVQHARLHEIWDNPARPKRERYPEVLHQVFVKLMERFDLSYRVVMPEAGSPETSLVAQLVPGGRPEGWQKDWPGVAVVGDSQRTQVCRIVDVETGRTAEVEGLLNRLIVRLHRYSLGRNNYFDSRHWKTGMILDDGPNGRAFIEEIGGDVQVSVRAAYPERFLHLLCEEVRWLVEHFWKGLDCLFAVPCDPPACKGLIELQEMFDNLKEGIEKVRCPVCRKYHAISDKLATVAPKPAWSDAVAELKQGHVEIQHGLESGFAVVNTDLRRLISQADEQFDLLMNALSDPAKEGPRLFSFEAVDPGFWDKPRWISEKFRLTLWCEHSRLPLPLLTGEDKLGVYTVELTRDWVKKSAPVLKILSNTLSLALPIAGSGAKLALDSTMYKAIEDQLSFGKACAEGFLKGGQQIGDWLSSADETELDRGHAALAKGVTLRELHALLKAKDKTDRFGGLTRVQNKRREFLWVHPQFENEY